MGKSAPYTANPQAAQALGLDASEAQLILDDLNAEPDPDAGKEDWQRRKVRDSARFPSMSFNLTLVVAMSYRVMIMRVNATASVRPKRPARGPTPTRST